MQTPNFEETVDRILARELRYGREAYRLVDECIKYTRKNLGVRTRETTHTHLTGKQLLEGFRSLVLEQYGPMARTVLAEWGITRCEDFGELIFIMVDAGLLNKTKDDTREDYKGSYDFYEAFDVPFLPSARQPKAERSPTPSPDA